MVQCSECGLLAVWDVRNHEFLEASDHCRSHGFPEGYTRNLQAYKIRCFIQKADLVDEVLDGDYIVNLQDTVREVITKPRLCNGHTPWIQGFDPKETKQMLLNEAMLESQRAHERNSLEVAKNSFLVAIIALGVSAVSIGATVIITSNSARLSANATLEAARMQIDANKEIAKIDASKPLPPINVVVQIPNAIPSKNTR